MKASIHVRPAAVRDVADQAEWYEDRGSGVGVRFREAFSAVLGRLERNPRSGSPVHHRLDAPTEESGERFYRIPIRHFPFSIYYAYSTRSASVTIVAVCHTSRDPEWISSRIDI